MLVQTHNWEEAVSAYLHELSHHPSTNLIITEYIPVDISIARKYASINYDIVADIQPDPEGIFINPKTGIAYVEGQNIKQLTKLEYKLLSLFYSRPNQIVVKSDISDAIWNEEYGKQHDGRIEKLVSRLRKKLEPDPKAPIYLTSLRGRGYRLNIDAAIPHDKL